MGLMGQPLALRIWSSTLAVWDKGQVMMVLNDKFSLYIAMPNLRSEADADPPTSWNRLVVDNVVDLIK